MFAKLALLLKLRSWLKSKTLWAGGLVGFLGTAQVFLSSQEGLDLVDMVAGWIGLQPATLGGILLGLIGLATMVLRALTEWGLDEKDAVNQ